MGAHVKDLSFSITQDLLLSRSAPSLRGKLIVCRTLTNESTPSLLHHATGINADEVVSKTMGMTDTSLCSTTEHRLWLFAGCSSLLGMLFKSALAAGSSPELWGITAFSSVSAYVLADLATGIYHWGIDNYGDAQTLVFGPQIDAFQGHHKRPWTITKREFANNIHALARPAALFLLPVLLTPNNAGVDAFLGVFLACVVFSQQFHAWAHMKKSQVPGVVANLQNLGLLVSPRMHGRHHRVPYNSNYCIVSGMCNGLLDESQALKRLEKFIFLKCGRSPRCWLETPHQWLQEGSYFEDGTNNIL